MMIMVITMLSMGVMVITMLIMTVIIKEMLILLQTSRKSQVDGVDAHGDRQICQDWDENICRRRVRGYVCD